MTIEEAFKGKQAGLRLKLRRFVVVLGKVFGSFGGKRCWEKEKSKKLF